MMKFEETLNDLNTYNEYDNTKKKMLQYIGAYVKSHHNIFFISEKLIIDWLITYICHIGIEKNIFYLYEL
jgi:hypothetical protein